jgi:acyl carrier protein
MTDLLAEVTDIISRHSSFSAEDSPGIMALTPETRLEDVHIESLDLVEIIFEIEERFKIEVPFNANNPKADSRLEFTTVGQIVEGVRSILAKSTAS